MIKITVKTLYPQRITQSNETGTNYREFNNLNNLKNDANSYARTGQIASKSGTHRRPSTLTCTKFQANIPEGSKINKITLEYEIAYEGNIAIGKPTIDILKITGDNQKGKSLSKTVTKTSVSWTGNHIISNINHEDFGVKISFPENTKADVGYVKIKYIRLKIDYTSPNFTVTSSKLNNGYTGDVFRVKLTVQNKNKTSTSPDVQITLPNGVTYTGNENNSKITGSGSNLVWKPGLTSKTTSATTILLLQVTTNGNHNIKFKENITNHSNTLNIKTTTKPDYPPDDDSGEGIDDDPNLEIYTVNTEPGEDFYLDLSDNQITIPTDVIPTGVLVDLEFHLTCSDVSLQESITHSSTPITDVTLQDIQEPYQLRTGKFAVYPLAFYYKVVNYSDHSTVYYTSNLRKYFINSQPDPLPQVSYTILKPTQEELDRLKDSTVYIAQSYLKAVQNQEYLKYGPRDFRVGVFNNINPNIDTSVYDYDDEGNPVIYDPTNYDTLTPEQIYDYAAYWSNRLTTPNTYESLTVEFPYDEDYPLYIIITGDYGGDSDVITGTSAKYTEPAIIEADVYNGWETNGNYPYPINSLLNAENDYTTLTLGSFSSSQGVVFSDFDLGDLMEENTVVKGLTLEFDVNMTDTLTVNSQLIAPGGKTGERSIVVNSDEPHITIGGSNDRWGLLGSDFENLEQFEIVTTITNNYNTDTGASTIEINNAVLTVYYNTYESTTVECFVEGENLNAYDFFLQDLKIPEGLETDTKTLNVDGTDLNSIYRQNIKEKTIEMEFSIDGCNIEESTQSFRELIKLFVNERTALNKPIPKRIEFSNYPDVYWEYVMEEAVDYKVETASYSGKIKLTIPAGTAYNKEETSTGKTGRVSGLAKINPVITLVPLSDTIGVEETITEQNFNITYTNWDTNSTVIIDCSDRTVTLNKDDTETDLTAYVDINCDWFNIHDEFSFEENNCIIQSVTWRERQ